MAVVEVAMVEVAAVGMAARNTDPAAIEGMERALGDAERLVKQPAAFTAASMAFHAAVGEASRNRFLSIMMQAISLALVG